MKNLKKVQILLFVIAFLVALLVSSSVNANYVFTYYNKPNLTTEQIQTLGIQTYSIEGADEMYPSLEYYVQDGKVVIFSANMAVDPTTKEPVLKGTFTVPAEINGLPVTKIDDYAFAKAKGITKIVLPETITTIGDHAFWQCEALEEINIPKSVTEINSCAFYNCISLKSITIPEALTTIKEATFKYCEALTSIVIPQNVTKIEGYAFDGCKSLTTVQFPEKLSEIGDYAFQNTGLKKLEIPETVTKIGSFAFSGMKNLTEVKIPNSIVEISSYMFSGCYSLTNVVLPEKLETIGGGAFLGCPLTEKITIPNRVKTIGACAFESCTNLKKIEIPNSVRTIYSRAFSSNANLTDVYWSNAEIVIPEDCFDECNLAKLTFYGYVRTTPASFAEARNIKFVYYDSTGKEMGKETFKDEKTSIQVTTDAQEKAELDVQTILTTSETYRTMINGLEGYNVIGAYEISIKEGEYAGQITITFTVDSAYEGKEVVILHEKGDASIEKFEDKVKNGKVTITTSELSPFIVAVKATTTSSSAQTAALDDVPKTGDSNTILTVAMLSILTLGMVIKVKKY